MKKNIIVDHSGISKPKKVIAFFVKIKVNTM